MYRGTGHSRTMNEAARANVVSWQNLVDKTHAGLTDQFAGAPAQAPAPPGVTRGLTEEEKAVARAVFGDSLNLDKIQLTDDSLLGKLKADNAISTPGTINFPPGTLTNKPNEYNWWLVHELTHQWQYQHGRTVLDLIPDAAIGGIDHSHYKYVLEPGKRFTSYNYEQQGNILADYYYNKTHGLDTKPYDDIVRLIHLDATDVLHEPGPPPGPAI